jgi:hypothetical protein
MCLVCQGILIERKAAIDTPQHHLAERGVICYNPGGGTLYCWLASIETACASMLDTTRIDTKKITADSIKRSVFWACASTCIDGSLHEIGHSMGLPHTNER